MSLPTSVVPGHVVRAPVAGSLPTAKLVSEVALLQRRLAGRAAIEHAKGALMERLGCTAGRHSTCSLHRRNSPIFTPA